MARAPGERLHRSAGPGRCRRPPPRLGPRSRLHHRPRTSARGRSPSEGDAADEPDDHDFGRSRGGLTTKIHLVSNGRSRPQPCHLTPARWATHPLSPGHGPHTSAPAEQASDDHPAHGPGRRGVFLPRHSHPPASLRHQAVIPQPSRWPSRCLFRRRLQPVRRVPGAQCRTHSPRKRPWYGTLLSRTTVTRRLTYLILSASLVLSSDIVVRLFRTLLDTW